MHFRAIRLFNKIKGDPLKVNAKMTLTAAEKLINAGVLAWKNLEAKY
jgi:hypothetical protein